ncbi:substrate-binding domain-containing protein [Klebsiella pneumoniae]|uniref:substrate-binding domain-containing protein n=2 Tax=Klebsiella pneumoniae TaxID=573 RepID=UPI00301AE85E
MSHRFLVPRLSLMMFMQFFIWGSWSVTLGLVMTRYEMSLLIGDAFSAGPIASILSPFVLGMLVDRFFASQKVMAVMHLAGAAILWFVPQALVAQNGALLIGLLFGYTLCYMPTLALTNNIAFHSLANVDKTFPVVRVFGTIGWIIAGICIGVTGISDTTGIFTLAALCSVALALYSLTLPHTPAPAKGMPVQFRDLLCAEYADTGSISCVGINDVEAAQGAVSRLADSGRRRIALINHDLSYRYARLRERGYKSVLHVHGLAYQQVTYAQDLSAAAGKRAMEQLLSRDEKPDAVFAVSDSLAAGALRAIAQAGLRVPEDIAVIGFDGTELAEVVSPQLTTVEQPSRAIGRTAVSLLMKRIDDPDAAVERVMMDWRVIDRASV